MNAPKISIILPVFNAQTHLAPLLASLLAQTETSLEIIAVDDGSTDTSRAILEKIALSDPRLLVLSQPNSGVSSARNHALRRARGHWLAFADSDDWISPDTLALWLRHAEQASLDILIGNGFNFSENPEEQFAAPNPLYQRQPWGQVTCGADWIIHSVATDEWPHYVWLQLVRRDFVARNHASFTEGIVHEDIIWTLHLALAAQRVGFLPAPLYGYRRNPASIMGSLAPAALVARAEGYLAVIAHFATVAAQQPRRSPLRRALLRHANRESGHFLGLIRKRVADPALRRSLARQFLRARLPRAMFQGAADGHDLWRALRCWSVLHCYALGLA